jgi:hypothetical protein
MKQIFFFQEKYLRGMIGGKKTIALCVKTFKRSLALALFGLFTLGAIGTANAQNYYFCTEHNAHDADGFVWNGFYYNSLSLLDESVLPSNHRLPVHKLPAEQNLVIPPTIPLCFYYYHGTPYEKIHHFYDVPVKILQNVYNTSTVDVLTPAAREALLSVTIPSSVEEIRGPVFKDAVNLQQVNFSEGIKVIGSEMFANGGRTFMNCTSLDNVVIPASATLIGVHTFENCTSLQSLTFSVPATSLDIHGNAFNGCTALTTLSLSGNISDKGAFQNCTGLTTIYYNSSETLTNDVGPAFANSPLLTDLYIGADVRQIPGYYFSETSLPSIHFEEGVVKLGRGAFSQCNSLTEITVPASVSVWGNSVGVFQQCTALKKATILSSTIGEYAFRNCPVLQTVDISDNVTAIAKGAFVNCTGLQQVKVHWQTPLDITQTESYNAVFYNVTTANVTLIVPHGTKAAYQAAPVWQDFSIIEDSEPGGIPVTDITGDVPSSIEEKDELLLSEDYYKGSVLYKSWNMGTVSPDNADNKTVTWSVQDEGTTGAVINTLQTYRYLDGQLLRATQSTLTTTAAGTLVLRATVADGTAVGTDFTKDFTVTISEEGNIRYGDGYIYDKTTHKLTLLTNAGTYNWRYDKKIPSQGEGNSFFYQVYDIEIQSTVTDIHSYAFESAMAYNVTVPGSVKTIGDYAFANSFISHATLETGVETIGAQAFFGSVLAGITLPEGLKTIGDGAFRSCMQLSGTISIPASVEYIGSWTFWNNVKLEGIEVASGSQYFSSEEGVLFDAAKEKLVMYPIGNARTSYSVPASVKIIGESSFYYCRNIESITFGENINLIESAAFTACENLSSLTFKSMTSPTLVDFEMIDHGGSFTQTDGSFYRISANGTVYYPEGATGYTKEVFNKATYSNLFDGWSFESVETETFVPVTDITDVPATMTATDTWILRYDNHSKLGTVVPSDATNRDIVWSIQNAGTSGASIVSSSEVVNKYVDGQLVPVTLQLETLHVTAPGTLVLTATVADGLASGTDFTKDFTITVNTPTPPTPPTVHARTPLISGHPQSATVIENEPVTLSVSASVSDGGTLSYQWYINTANSNSGGTAIGGATTSSYSPPTATGGDCYYYVVVTNTNTSVNGAQTATATSDVARVRVSSPTGLEEEAQAKTLKAWTQNGRLHVSGLAVGQMWRVYNISGSLVYHSLAESEEANIILPVRGMYIVQSANAVVKTVYY